MLCLVKTATSRTAPEYETPPAPDTPDKLIAAAERLFAENGYTNVSVRVIAAAAGVNWSLVGYYFRGKEDLLSEVYRRHCSSLNAERPKLLGQARRKGLELEAVIEAFARPALAEIQTGHGETSFSRLRAILAAEDSALLNQLVADNFDRSGIRGPQSAVGGPRPALAPGAQAFAVTLHGWRPIHPGLQRAILIRD
jgi:AcrR family transcriptional regulator